MSALNLPTLHPGFVARNRRDPDNQNVPPRRVLQNCPILAVHWFGVDLGVRS